MAHRIHDQALGSCGIRQIGKGPIRRETHAKQLVERGYWKGRGDRIGRRIDDRDGAESIRCPDRGPIRSDGESLGIGANRQRGSHRIGGRVDDGDRVAGVVAHVMVATSITETALPPAFATYALSCACAAPAPRMNPHSAASRPNVLNLLCSRFFKSDLLLGSHPSVEKCSVSG
jgi:hypothetical protein